MYTVMFHMIYMSHIDYKSCRIHDEDVENIFRLRINDSIGTNEYNAGAT